MKKIIYLLLFVIIFNNCKRKDKSYYETGELLRETFAISDTLSYAIEYYKNGNKKYEGMYNKDSVCRGVWKEYYDDGELKIECILEDGIPTVPYENDTFPDMSKRDAYIRYKGEREKMAKNKAYHINGKQKELLFRTYVDSVYETFYMVDCVSYSGTAEVKKTEAEDRKDSYPYDLVVRTVPDTIIIRYNFCNEEGLIIRDVTPSSKFIVIVEE